MTGVTEKPRQLPLDLGFGTAYSRDDLVGSPAYAEAVSLTHSLPVWAAPVVVLAGPSGAGKTHLASVWCEAADALRISPSAIGEAVAELDGRPALIDDVDSGELDQQGLFHLVNSVRASGSHLLL